MSYYYLISSLPELSPVMDASRVDFDELFDSIKRNLDEQDIRLFQYLIYPNDIQNLVTVLSAHNEDRSSIQFKNPSIIHPEEIEAFKINRRSFPDFMNDFISENEDRLLNMSPREMEDAMLSRFQEELRGLNNSFLIDYFKFLKGLKSVIAAYNFNTYDFLTKPNISDAERLILQVGPDRTPSASLIQDYPIVEELIKALSENQPERTEQFIDQMLWDFVDETARGQFSSEAVMAYVIKLQILKRWFDIEQETHEGYDTLIDNIINNNPSQKLTAS